MPIRERAGRFCVAVAITLVVGTFAGATEAFAHQNGTRPFPGRFQGEFHGKGLGNIDIEVMPEGSQSSRIGIRWLGGFVPGVCVKDGKTRVAWRDGAIGIQFNRADELRVDPRTEIAPDGTFAFRLVHAADVSNGASYSVSVRGTFGRKTVSGRVKGTGSDPLSGKCRVNRMFTARLRDG